MLIQLQAGMGKFHWKDCLYQTVVNRLFLGCKTKADQVSLGWTEHWGKITFSLSNEAKENNHEWPLTNSVKATHLLYVLNLIINRCNPHFSTAKDCGPLKTPSNGSFVGNLTTYPQKVQFMCDEGFNLRGSKIRQCLSTGNWSGNESFCKGKKKYVENVIDCKITENCF